MPIPQAPRPSFSIVVNSGPVSIVLRDYQRARNRDIQLPIYGPLDPLTQTADLHHTLGFLTYKCDYISSPMSPTSPHQDAQSIGESGDSGEEPALTVDRSLWSRMKALLFELVVILLVTQRFLTTYRRD
ncbi:hypothetical protein K443DRAFT_221958 [Laccaria amethystina LaAM-08-1]|uniref:Uncharacterized protein n=1 Tax=Laccaria amethystina LaAM-08-1 TaxID=1095629 RepID=A0A0C9XKD5_9AGAR|nr:hypothetical protein K443DRAFT_221958 [Laccaria amethystina LaAM-08-1]